MKKVLRHWSVAGPIVDRIEKTKAPRYQELHAGANQVPVVIEAMVQGPKVQEPTAAIPAQVRHMPATKAVTKLGTRKNRDTLAAVLRKNFFLMSKKMFGLRQTVVGLEGNGPLSHHLAADGSLPVIQVRNPFRILRRKEGYGTAVLDELPAVFSVVEVEGGGRGQDSRRDGLAHHLIEYTAHETDQVAMFLGGADDLFGVSTFDGLSECDTH